MKTPIRSLLLFPRLHTWLSPADAPRSADLAFVLAGRVHRKEYALELFRQGLVPRVLFSVGRFEIRRFSKMNLPVPLDLLKMAQDVAPPQRHYFAYFQGQEVRVEHVPPGRFGTLTEIEALAKWLAEKSEIQSVLVISTDTHLRRIRMCCRALLNPEMDISFLAAPPTPLEKSTSAAAESQPNYAQSQETSAAALVFYDLLELFKLSIYWVLLKIR